jgi:hypothetical protein
LKLYHTTFFQKESRFAIDKILSFPQNMPGLSFLQRKPGFMSLARRIIIIWMMAVTIHFPFPVCDGDDLKSWESPAAALWNESLEIDIDLVLLGCLLPEDADDGPVDDDPEKGAGSAFGDYFTSLSSSNGETQNPLTGHFGGGEYLVICPNAETGDGILALPHALLSLGKSSQQGPVVLRC